MRRVLAALMLFAACAPFEAEPSDAPPPPPPPPPPDEPVVKPPPTIEPDASADSGAPPGCGAPFAVRCEDFQDETYDPGWTIRPTRGFLARDQGEGAGKVMMGTKWGESAKIGPDEDATDDVFAEDIPIVAKTRRAVSIALRVRVEQMTSGQSVELAKLTADTFVLHFNVQQTGDAVELVVGQYDRNSYEDVKKTIGSLASGWHHIRLELEIGGDRPSFSRLDVDDVKGDPVRLLAPKDTDVTAHVQAAAGLSYINEFKGPFTYYVDDIAVTAETR